MKTKETHNYTLKTQPGYNPFFLFSDNGMIGEVRRFNFFKVENGEGMVIATSRWFAIMRGKGRKSTFIGSNNDFGLLHLPYAEIPYKRKLDFAGNDAFYMKVDNGIDVYFNVDKLDNFKIEQSEPQSMYDGSEIHISDIVTFDAPGISRRTEWDGDEDSVKTAVFTCNHKSSKTELGMLCDQIATISNSGYSGISSYNVAKLIASGDMDKIVDLYTSYKSTLSENR